ncbi:MAG: LTA synthase family protein [Patescibacteria group bacterium]|jgi:phosphoglycerol transferase MdoB-like AlkP superfamily enzyme
MFDLLFKSHGGKNRWYPGSLYVLAGSFIIAIGWGWYHFHREPGIVYFGKIVLLSFFVAAAFFAAKLLYWYFVKITGRHFFWREHFYYNFNELFFYSSFLFFIFFIETEWLSLVYCLLLLPLLFWRLQKMIAVHLGSKPWLALNRSFFYLIYFFFCLESILQYVSYHYYILDGNIKYFNIVLFRSFAMSSFWLLGFALANYFYFKLRNIFRYFLLVLWIVLFSFSLLIWTINLGILYYSGLYFSPIAMEHASGAGGVLINSLTFYLVGFALLVYVIFLILVRKNLRDVKKFGARYSNFYNFTIGITALAILLGLTSFKNTPEHAIATSFYRYYLGTNVVRELDLPLQKKLAKFGLIYEPNQFFVNSRSEIFSPTTTKLLPDRFRKTPPNILIIELESFSSRLTGPYGTKFPDLTPGLDQFAADKNTTIFHKYYNASTPTITGTLSQLCSFLPPTGHNEIQNERKLQSHRLLCLPEILKKDGAYKYTAYVTAVDKNFANKNGIFTSMGVDKVFGTSELAEYIKDKPLSWGYSDHQMFPIVLSFMKTAPQPFLMMLATVDTHPPFDLAKDPVNYGDGSQPVLNMFHTTDDAFKIFWNEFEKSDLYKNTIVIAVADHAIFPGALTKDLFPKEAKTLTYYDENFFGIYIPDTVLPKKIDIYSSGIDLAPTVLQILNINTRNSFDGHSIFDDRSMYPNLLGMHELGLYINQVDKNGKRKVSYDVPSEIKCEDKNTDQNQTELSLCDFLHYYEWKRQMFEEGRFWKQQ